jgi:predicted flavoprotein YhiN
MIFPSCCENAAYNELIVNFDVVVIGGGAAGLMCAIEAGKRGRRVAVLEHNESIGKKIRISGGGRCNFTNLHTAPDNFISENPNFHKSALSRYTPSQFIELVRKYGIAFHEKKNGQLFCDSTAEEIITMLRRECAAAHVDVRTGCRVSEVRKSGRFALTTSDGDMTCESLVVATGGLSIPKIGASDFGYRLARQFGIRITEVRPGLVPFSFEGAEKSLCRELTGVSVDAVVSLGRERFHENVLFTHQGLSGPAILQVSLYWHRGEAIELDILPDPEKPLPRRLLQKWTALYGPVRPLTQCTKKEIEDFNYRLRHWTLTPSGTEGYAKAEVTAGGVDTNELSSKTMESRRVRGLYFIGEVVDVTGQLGGFNFQWAWSSGFVAGQYV